MGRRLSRSVSVSRAAPEPASCTRFLALMRGENHGTMIVKL